MANLSAAQRAELSGSLYAGYIGSARILRHYEATTTRSVAHAGCVARRQRINDQCGHSTAGAWIVDDCAEGAPIELCTIKQRYIVGA